jgi:hypothetical protein
MTYAGVIPNIPHVSYIDGGIYLVYGTGLAWGNAGRIQCA